jgi:hypothetical protein
MKVFAIRTGFFGALIALSLCACSDETTCTLENRLAITVQVESPQGLPVDSVTATRRREQACESQATSQDASGPGSYECGEQGGGTYTVRVTSGELQWTQRVDISADECHTTEHQTLEFVLDPDTAD